MRLSNAERAVVDIAKLRDYCLNPDHTDGRHKARVFAAALGLTAADADELHTVLLSVIQTNEATLTRESQYGRLYALDFMMSRGSYQAWVRSSWIVRYDEDFPRLTSCYVIEE